LSKDWQNYAKNEYLPNKQYNKEACLKPIDVKLSEGKSIAETPGACLDLRRV
jgi:hypothetical protein